MNTVLRFLPFAVVAAVASCGSDDLEPIRAPGTAGAATSGGPVTDGGASSSGSPSGGGSTIDPGASCKRGIAANATPGAVFSPSGASAGVSWWYDWSNSAATGIGAGIEFVPMIWGGGDRTKGPIPAGSHHLLGFNEPNFKAQSNLTPKDAASQWPAVEAQAAGLPIVSPAVNYCGSPEDPSGCSDPSVTSPYAWLKAFFADCPGCRVDAIAIHWYNCDLPSLQGYIEGNGGGLEGFVQFGKPIWLTEFACDGGHSVADQQAYMKAAIPYLEGNSHIQRYSWFSADPIPNARLANADGSLTDLGKTYVALPQSCP